MLLESTLEKEINMHNALGMTEKEEKEFNNPLLYQLLLALVNEVSRSNGSNQYGHSLVTYDIKDGEVVRKVHVK